MWLKKKSRILPVSNHTEVAWQGGRKGYGMRKSTKTARPVQPAAVDDALTRHLRARVAEWLTTLLEHEVREAVGAGRYARCGPQRHGYRHATRRRTLTTSAGTCTLAVPRARLFADGATREWQSHILPRYARRTGRMAASADSAASTAICTWS